ncbi:hypothetical protein [Antrihabitans sp. YC2-6]|uniref:hypothetical protein n=1 Tax=Antrihabitans sp. YC2-6 TaxID=2799498 RepID=UPI0018F4A20F|nr:hypothetical protein [Antrihabitans sp. YC2-6]MBJ8348140.1 hypothetical protein [Antrihabitans sp. YC2-6]
MSGTGDWPPSNSSDDRWREAGQPPPGYQPEMPPPGYQPGMPPAGPRSGPDGYGKPGVIPLRPLQVADILGGAIATIRRYPALILGVSAAVAVVTGIVVLAIRWGLRGQLETISADADATAEEQLDALRENLPAILGGTAGGAVITLLATTFLTGFLTVVVGEAVLGRPIGFAAALAQLRPRLLPLLGLIVVYALIVLVGIVFCVVPGIWLYVLFGLATPALVLERQSIGGALSRSRDLVSGSWWRIFGILLLAMVLAILVSSVITFPFGLVGNGYSTFSGMEESVTFGGLLVTEIGEMIASTFVTPFAGIVTVLLFTDQRIRKENLHTQLAREAGAGPYGQPGW